MHKHYPGQFSKLTFQNYFDESAQLRAVILYVTGNPTIVWFHTILNDVCELYDKHEVNF